MQDNPVVLTSKGAVRGLSRNGTTRYLNIPYAAAPGGSLRFAAPQPHAPWQDERDGTAWGPTAPQPARNLGALDMSPFFGTWHRGEDYLTANVWTPDTSDRKLPVMVFVHGGGFVAGSSRASLYDGAAFARDNVVLVTLNYRLGIHGFLDLPGAPANRGLLDVIAGLRWVRTNIAAFKGDPDNVTLFGQSAGATIVSGALATPEAKGLFHRAIVQSGNPLGAFSSEQAARVTSAAASTLGAAPHAAAFAGLTDEQLVDTTAGLSGIDLKTPRQRDPLMGLTAFSLVLDQQPADVVAAGLAVDVDLLVGTNSEEGNLYLAPAGKYAASSAADVDATAALAHPDPVRLVHAYRAQRPQASHGELRSAILGDALFGHGSRQLAEAHAALPAKSTHAYEFAWRSNALEGQLGATHAVELPFVFKTAGLPALHGPNALLGTATPPADLAARMHAAWVSFAHTGDPGWGQYDLDKRTTMRIDSTWSPVHNPRRRERQVWA
ncbi:carboxylesterase family protein [Streptomyces sp. NPDC005407]|uniref:carboxylesterase/lipase family protein n=1 Tax=Streptomyces sp. NPDC005407 TaxID=3155340 RepID=UPI0033A71BE6